MFTLKKIKAKFFVMTRKLVQGMWWIKVLQCDSLKVKTQPNLEQGLGSRYFLLETNQIIFSGDFSLCHSTYSRVADTHAAGRFCFTVNIYFLTQDPYPQQWLFLLFPFENTYSYTVNQALVLYFCYLFYIILFMVLIVFYLLWSF